MSEHVPGSQEKLAGDRLMRIGPNPYVRFKWLICQLKAIGFDLSMGRYGWPTFGVLVYGTSKTKRQSTADWRAHVVFDFRAMPHQGVSEINILWVGSWGVRTEVLPDTQVNYRNLVARQIHATQTRSRCSKSCSYIRRLSLGSAAAFD